MERSKAIFDWIFGIRGGSNKKYQLYYLASPNVGLSRDALEARRRRESDSLTSIRKLSSSIKSLSSVWSFLHTKHDLYTASKLADRARGASGTGDGATTSELKKSYGGG